MTAEWHTFLVALAAGVSAAFFTLTAQAVSDIIRERRERRELLPEDEDPLAFTEDEVGEE